jgi:type II secretory pathway pseudopilin PulG
MIELAVVLFIVALVLGSILVPLTTQVEQRQISDTQKTMEEIREALIGFAIANSYLPCPDTLGGGIADPPFPGVCTSAEGFLPWLTLSVPQGDVWGNRFRYRVSPEFTNTPPASGNCSTSDGRIGLCDSGNITVNTRTSSKSTQTLASNVVAVIISHGKNGYGATATTGNARVSAPASNVDETTNGNVAAFPRTFTSRTPTGISATCSDTVAGQPFCEFDDIVTWISRYTLFNRMVAAGKLP